IWNADTGDLWMIGHRPLPPQATSSVVLSRQSAVRAAWAWLYTLGIASKSSHWRPAAELGPERAAWKVVWHGAEWTATLRLDSCSGDLLFLQSWRATPVVSNGTPKL